MLIIKVGINLIIIYQGLFFYQMQLFFINNFLKFKVNLFVNFELKLILFDFFVLKLLKF
jgi:hypothetical protein